jgi:hypothetical protein
MSSRTLPAGSRQEVSMADKIAGIDVHKKILMVVVMDARTPESKPERRRFATMPGELRLLATHYLSKSNFPGSLPTLMCLSG